MQPHFINIQPRQQDPDRTARRCKKKESTLEKWCTGELTKAKQKCTQSLKLNRLICWRPKMWRWWYTNSKKKKSKIGSKCERARKSGTERARERERLHHTNGMWKYIQNQSRRPEPMSNRHCNENHLHHFQSTWKYVEFQCYVLIYLIPWSILCVCAWLGERTLCCVIRRMTKNSDNATSCQHLVANRRVEKKNQQQQSNRLSHFQINDAFLLRAPTNQIKINSPCQLLLLYGA